jgi:hypothetical protein
MNNSVENIPVLNSGIQKNKAKRKVMKSNEKQEK